MRLLALLPLLVACHSTKILRSPTLVPESPLPALQVSTIIETTSYNDDEGAVAVTQAVFDVVNNTQLDEFGATVRPTLEPWIQAQGLRAATDKERVMVGKSTDWAEVANSFTVLSGSWVDPEGLALRVATDTLFKGGTYKKMAEKLDGPEEKEAFVYTTLSVVKSRRWLVVGVPWVRVSVIAHDQDGQELLRARAWGRGKSAAFVANTSPESLKKALDEAIVQLKEGEVVVLEPKG